MRSQPHQQRDTSGVSLLSAQRFLHCYVKAENTPTTKQPYGIRSPVASDVLLSALNDHKVAVDYQSYHTFAKDSLHVPFRIMEFRYLAYTRVTD